MKNPTTQQHKKALPRAIARYAFKRLVRAQPEGGQGLGGAYYLRVKYPVSGLAYVASVFL